MSCAGQTGSGKTFTMMGPDVCDPSLKGIIPNAIDHMFDLISDDSISSEISLACSYLEVYREVIRDLIDPSKSNLQARPACLPACLPPSGPTSDGFFRSHESSAAPAWGMRSVTLDATSCCARCARAH